MREGPSSATSMAGSPKHSERVAQDGRKLIVVRNLVVVTTLACLGYLAYDASLGLGKVTDYMTPVTEAPSYLSAGGDATKGSSPSPSPTPSQAVDADPPSNGDGEEDAAVNWGSPRQSVPDPPAAVPVPLPQPRAVRQVDKASLHQWAMGGTRGKTAGKIQTDLAAETEGCPNYAMKSSWETYCRGMMDGSLFVAGEGGNGRKAEPGEQRTKGPMVALLGTEGKQAHASTMAELDDGTLLLAWFSGNEGKANVVIMLSRLRAHDNTWTPPRQVSGIKSRSAQNPVLFVDRTDGRVHLYHTSQGAGRGQGDAHVAHLHSDDGGVTWTEPKVLWKQGGPFVRNAFLLGKNGEWFVPMYYTPTGYGGFEKHRSTMKISPDRGQTWEEEAAMTGTGEFLAQPTVVRLQDGTLKAFYRHRKFRSIYVANSTDDGRTWSKAVPTRLPNNNSGIHALLLPSGALVMVFNNRNGRERHPMSVGLSYDAGETWPHVRDVERGGSHDPVPQLPEAGGKRGKRGKGSQAAKYHRRYSYPWALWGQDGTVHVSYTWRRVGIKYISGITEEWVKAGGTVGVYQPSQEQELGR